MRNCYSFVVLTAITFLTTSYVWAQPPEFNCDESKPPEYQLPDPLLIQDGTRVETARQWLEGGLCWQVDLCRKTCWTFVNGRTSVLFCTSKHETTLWLPLLLLWPGLILYGLAEFSIHMHLWTCRSSRLKLHVVGLRREKILNEPLYLVYQGTCSLATSCIAGRSCQS
jgi:hypothetical protein